MEHKVIETSHLRKRKWMVQQYVSPLSAPLNWAWQGVESSTVWASVVFGQPTLGCKGNGLCRVDLVIGKFSEMVKQKEYTGDHCEAFLVELSYEHNQLRMIVPCQQFSQKVYQEHFGKGFFKVEEAYCLPDNLTHRIGLSRKVVAKGLYLIEKKHDKLIIYLD